MKYRLVLFFLILLFHSFIGVFTSILYVGITLLARYLYVLTDILMIGLAFTAFWRNRFFYGSIALVLFILGALFTFILNGDHVGIVATLNGVREPLFFISSLVVVYDFYQLPIRDRFVSLFSRFLLIFALVQIPVAMVQFLQYGAEDYVGGTFGWGASGILTEVLFLTSFYFIVRKGSLEDGAVFDTKTVILYSLLLIPCAVNETKITFILFPLLISLIVFTRGKIYRAIPIVFLGVLIAFLLEYVYTSNVQDTSTIFDWQFIERYMYTGSTASGDMPRLARIPIMFHFMQGEPGAILLGLGYGLFAGEHVLGLTQMAKSLAFMGGSRTLLFTVWIQGGLVAVLVIAFAMNGFMRAKQETYHTLRRFKWFLFFSLLMIWVYNNAIYTRAFAIIVTFYMVFVQTGGDGEDAVTSAEGEDEAGDEHQGFS